MRTFNPLPSHEGRLVAADYGAPTMRLSIHFPLTREDCRAWNRDFEQNTFNPLPSHEGRHCWRAFCWRIKIFQSTSLSRGKTLAKWRNLGNAPFQSTSLSRGKTMPGIIRKRRYLLSIHFPLTREDITELCEGTGSGTFNPLPSHEGRQSGHDYIRLCAAFQSTSLSRGKTTSSVTRSGCFLLSIHFPLTREDSARISSPVAVISFQSTSLSRGKTL